MWLLWLWLVVVVLLLLCMYHLSSYEPKSDVVTGLECENWSPCPCLADVVQWQTGIVKNQLLLSQLIEKKYENITIGYEYIELLVKRRIFTFRQILIEINRHYCCSHS